MRPAAAAYPIALDTIGETAHRSADETAGRRSGRHRRGSGGMSSMADGAAAAGVSEAARAVLGERARVEGEPHKLAGGTMHDMWAVDTDVPEGRLELVVRTSPRVRGDLTVAQWEFAAISASRRQGVVAPRVYGVGQSAEGEPYLVMERIAGDSSPRPLLRDPAFADARNRIVAQLAESLVRIHAVRPRDLDVELTGPAPGEDALTAQWRMQSELYERDRLQRYPVLEWAFRWLHRRIQTATGPVQEPVLVHGDFRVGNIMYDAKGLTGVLDWEGCHAGDPLEDLAWLCVRVWRFGQNSLEAGGLVSREDWIRAYEAASGRAVDRARFTLWEVLLNVRWAIITLNQVKTHLDGTVRSQELAAIGRRTAETELEILRLVRASAGGD
jgi:aminoglycoside phosphotransferase (APT) family kinase protein